MGLMLAGIGTSTAPGVHDGNKTPTKIKTASIPNNLLFMLLPPLNSKPCNHKPLQHLLKSKNQGLVYFGQAADQGFPIGLSYIQNARRDFIGPGLQVSAFLNQRFKNQSVAAAKDIGGEEAAELFLNTVAAPGPEIFFL